MKKRILSSGSRMEVSKCVTLSQRYQFWCGVFRQILVTSRLWENIFNWKLKNKPSNRNWFVPVLSYTLLLVVRSSEQEMVIFVDMWKKKLPAHPIGVGQPCWDLKNMCVEKLSCKWPVCKRSFGYFISPFSTIDGTESMVVLSSNRIWTQITIAFVIEIHLKVRYARHHLEFAVLSL